MGEIYLFLILKDRRWNAICLIPLLFSINH
jgi:hypothetical protein